MAPRLELDLSEIVWKELQRRQREGTATLSEIVEQALTDAFDLQRHSLYQVSTSSALAQGVFSGAVTVVELRQHGDFGLGTFEWLDGELILLDGHCFRATAGGAVTEVDDWSEVPFALVTHFSADLVLSVESVADLASLKVKLDESRPSENVFAAARIDGRFESLTLRAACPARAGEGLLEATAHQSEFSSADVEGTLVGFWAPEYAHTFGIPGYHFHFISADRLTGGHVLGLSAGHLDIEMQTETSVHLAIPETTEFLDADLSGDHREAIDSAETNIRGASED